MHKGHLYCIDTAARQCDHVTVLMFVGGDDELRICAQQKDSFLSAAFRQAQLERVCAMYPNVVCHTVDVTALKLPDGMVVVANEQTGGRGRLGRSFQSQADKGVYLSVLLRPDILPAQALNLTAFVAVAVCEGIEAATGLSPQIKWTNDIVLENKKVCGILTEMSVEGESGALQHIVTGIGINVNQMEEDFPEEIRDMAGSLRMMKGEEIPRGRLAAEIINALDRMYAAWTGNGADYLERYRQRCLTVGKQVKLLRADGSVEEVQALGVDDDFGLVVEHSDSSRETITSGEVSVRGLWGYV
jgi:BirA family biotin operon repressor/biotin-[acetyl-CoA-carboxylase] ligase